MLDIGNALGFGAGAMFAVSASESLDQAVAYVQRNGVTLLLNLLAAAAIFFIGRWVARLLTGIVRRVMDRAYANLPDDYQWLKDWRYV